jgi:isopentenyl-diphosphate delta-isomerase
MTESITERIVIVDEDDTIIGDEEKEKCHDGDGILHRGFLVMVFNHKGELLLGRRSNGKRLWPGFWDGTVASHVLTGEGYEQAAKRRLIQEIGLKVTHLRFLFKFQYKVRYKDVGTENEICAVATVEGVDTEGLVPDPGEISDMRAVPPQVLREGLSDSRIQYTPWLILAMEHMNMLHPCAGIPDR